MSDERFIVEYGENNLPFFADLEEHRDMSIKEVVDLLNRQDYAIEVKQKYIEKLEKQLEQIPKSIREVWLEE